MFCPKCGNRVSVTNTRHADSPRFGKNVGLLDDADEVVGWYTQDWVVRQRDCKSCTWSAVTIEVTKEDWVTMQKMLKNKKT